MLKWLKQKPMHGQGEMSTEKITDDPLATIQVHPSVKKSKNKSNEIYAVSRVNPLFEEEDPKSVFSPGNNSGSSGYDSGPSDDDIPGSPKYGQTVVLTSTLSESVPTKAEAPGRISSTLSSNPPQLFQDNDDFVIHHEAALVGPDGQPVLQILQQNTNYVKSISVSVPTRRPLSPIEESHGLNDTSGNKSSNGPFRVNAMPVPQRNGVQEDSVGVGKVIQKNPKYVQSIRIGPSGGLKNQPGHLAKTFGEHKKLGRKPSVTFSERVDYLVEGNLHVPLRKNSADHDSIVTDSLLQMTSKDEQFEHLHGNWGTRKFSLVSDFNNRRARNNSSGSKGSINRGSVNTSSDENEYEENKDAPDLEAFSNSMKKNRPIRSGLTPNRSLEEPRPVVDKERSSGRTEDDDDDDHENDERSESSSASQQDSPVRPRTPRGNNVNGRSPFGGIADHYAAAKEIAREIDSYAIGSTKSTKRSLVRDLLLSSRGRGGSSSSSSSNNVNQQSQDPAVKPLDGHTPAAGKSHSSKSEHQQQQHYSQQHQPPQQQQPRELVRVQQVYVKENSTQLSTSPQNEGQDHIQSNSQQVPIYDALPRAGSLSRHDDSDSGNSSDRTPGEVRLEMGEDEDGEPHLVISPSLPSRDTFRKAHPSSASTASSSDESGTSSSGVSHGSNHSKVMLVSGDSQNMVVDLSAVPPDLREAILAGTALITLPDGAKKRLEPGYTMIAIPPSNSSSSSDLKENQIMKVSDTSSSSGHSSGSEDSPLSQNKFSTKNKTQIWNVMQQHQISATLTSVGKKGFTGKSKKFTTVLPFHPNHDSNTSPDFTIEGHRLKMQMKKVQHGKTRRCWCRVCGMLFFLIAFLGILVALSMIYTRGERYFGSV